MRQPPYCIALVIGWDSLNFNQMDKEIQKIVDAIKINVEIAKVDGKPLIVEVSLNDKSKEYIAKLIKEYGNIRYQEGLEMVQVVCSLTYNK